MKRNLLSAFLTLWIVTVMVGLSEFFHQPELLFPEIAAIVVGMLVAPRRPWQVSGIRMLGMIALGAVIGVLLVRTLPLPLPVLAAAAFLCSQVVYLLSGTTFAPVVSATVLPVLLGSTSMVYPLAAVGFTALVLVLRTFVEELHLLSPEPFCPQTPPVLGDWKDAALRVACVLVLALALLPLGWKFALAPPLLVYFTEASRRDGDVRKRPGVAAALLTLCAVFGTLARIGLCGKLGWSLTLGAAFAAGAMLLAMHLLRFFLPPAGALTLLAFLIPEEAVLWYPVQVLAGSALLTVLALALFRKSAGQAPAETEERESE